MGALIPPPLRPYWSAYRQKRRAREEVERAFRSAEGPILVYQMGKVGSTTVCRSLEKINLGPRVLHAHFLSKELPEKRKRYISTIRYPPAYHYEVSLEIRKRLLSGRGHGVKIITLVREPVSRFISSVYQVPELMGADVKTTGGTIQSDKAVEFIEKRLGESDAFEYEYTWFDREIKTVFGIDVFSQPFPKEQGWFVFRQEDVEVLILRLEDLSIAGPTALAAFLDLPEPPELVFGKVRSASGSGESYESVKQIVILPEQLLRQLYRSDFVRHFYTEEMVEDFVQRWSSGADR